MQKGRVISTTRRNAKVSLSDSLSIDAILRNCVEEVVVGDIVEVEENGSDYIISKPPVRKNILSRTLGEKQKNLVSNIDMLFVASAVKPAFNTIFVDRVLASAAYEEIPVTLLYHKIDIDDGRDDEILSVYEKIGYTILKTTLRQESGLSSLSDLLRQPTIEGAALCGISGVGKSSIINALIPHASQETSVLSSKADQGKQTTTMAVAHILERASTSLFLVDLPGLQNYGITHIPLETLSSTFLEFQPLSNQCRFGDCSHTTEPHCAVMHALKEGSLSQFRYNSYTQMREEIVRSKPY